VIHGAVSGLPTCQACSLGGHLCEKRGTCVDRGTWCDLKVTREIDRTAKSQDGRTVTSPPSIPSEYDHPVTKTSSQFSFGSRDGGWPPDSSCSCGFAVQHPGIVATRGHWPRTGQRSDFSFTLWAAKPVDPRGLPLSIMPGYRALQVGAMQCWVLFSCEWYRSAPAT
jgi:hypothetical protein